MELQTPFAIIHDCTSASEITSALLANRPESLLYVTHIGALINPRPVFCLASGLRTLVLDFRVTNFDSECMTNLLAGCARLGITVASPYPIPYALYRNTPTLVTVILHKNVGNSFYLYNRAELELRDILFYKTTQP